MFDAEEHGSGKPKRGRPKNVDAGSRETLIQKTLTALRATPKLDIQRQVLADAANVTPALISYYFPDKWTLIYLAVSPIVGRYGADLKQVVDGGESGLDSLRALTTIYARFNMQDAMLLDFYLTSLQKTKRDEEFDAFKEIYASVIRLIASLMDAGYLRRGNPVAIQSSMWGLTRYVAQNFRTIPNLLYVESGAEAEGIASLVFDMIVDGAAERAEPIAGTSRRVAASWRSTRRED